MKNNTWLLSTALIALLSLSSAVYAHDEDGNTKHADWAAHHEFEGDAHRLPEDKMQILHQAMKASFEKDKGLHQQEHKLHKELRDVIKADSFDEKAFLSLNAKLESIHDQIHKDQLQAFASVAGQFTPEEREAVVRMHHEHEHHMHHGMHQAGWHHEPSEWQPQNEAQPGSGTIVNDPQTQVRDMNYPPYSPR